MLNQDQNDSIRVEVPPVGRLCNFPNKLYQILDFVQSENLETIVSWSSEGTSFVIYAESDFMQQISPRFFPNQSSFRSFERLLNVWGFTRLSTSRGKTEKLYFHPFFQRDKPELCRRINRVENKGSKKKVAGGIVLNQNVPEHLKVHQQAALNFLHQKQTKGNHAMPNHLEPAKMPISVAVLGHGRGLIQHDSSSFVKYTLGSASQASSMDEFGGLLQRHQAQNQARHVQGQFQDAPPLSITGRIDEPHAGIAINPNFLPASVQAVEEEQWERRFQELREFLRSSGHCGVPENYEPNPMLSIWVSNQRLLRQMGSLCKMHEVKLDAISFVWDKNLAGHAETVASMQVQPDAVHSENQATQLPSNTSDGRRTPRTE